MSEALNGLVIAVLLMLAGLIPYLGAAAKAALVTFTEGRHQASINAAADTLAAVAVKAGASLTDGMVAEQVAKLRTRVPDAVTALGVTDATLRDLLTKARVKLVGVGL